MSELDLHKMTILVAVVEPAREQGLVLRNDPKHGGHDTIAVQRADQ